MILINYERRGTHCITEIITMNTARTFQKYPKAITQLRHSDGVWSILVSFIYLLLGVGFAFITLYTLLRTISFIDMQLPPITFLISGAFVVSQGVPAYGFLYMKKWITSIAVLMILIDVLVFVFLYSLSYDDLALSVLTQVFILAPAVTFFMLTRNHLTGSYMQPLPIALYAISAVLTVTLGLSNVVLQNNFIG